MAQRPTEVRASEGSFGVLDAGTVQGDPADYSNGLIITMPAGARIHTGINMGPVRVTATAARYRPGTVEDIDSWDEVVEASVYAPRGRLRVESLDDGPVPGLPLLSPAGPGWYRLLVRARGRDDAYDAAVDRPTEDYVITAWPEQPSPARLLRTSDECGRSLRRSAPRQPTAHRTPSAPDTAENDRQAALRSSLLRAGRPPQPPSHE